MCTRMCRNMSVFLLIIILFSNISVHTKCKEVPGTSSQQMNYPSNTHKNCPGNDCHTLDNTNETQDFLLFSIKKRIMRLNLATKSVNELKIPNLTQVNSVDFDMNTQCVYWGGKSDINRHCSNSNQSESLLSENLSSVLSIALNLISHTLYFVNNGHSKIEVIRIDTVDRMRTTLLDKKVLKSPVSIAVHPKAGYIFWTDWSTENPSVSRAELDGTNVKTLYNKPKVKRPFGITIDYVTDRIYWVDAGIQYIASSELNGGLGKTHLHKSKTTLYPYAIAIFKNRMYWTDWQYEAIFSADKEEGKKFEVLYRNIVEDRAEVLKIFGKGSRVDTNDACKNTNCRYVCVEKPSGSSCLCPNDLIYEDHECVCPRNVGLVVNKTCQQERPKCLDDQFACSNLLCVQKNQTCDGKDDCGDGSDEKNCPDNDDSPKVVNYFSNADKQCTESGCSLLPNNFSFNETQDFLLFCNRTSIMQLNLATKSVYKLNTINSTQVYAIDFDMNTQCVYWAAHTINRQCLNKESEILLSENVKQVEGIALDWISHNLYFVNSNYSKIELIRIDTVDRMRTTILDNRTLDKPRGIAVHSKAGYMFWTDWSSQHPSVSRADLDGTNIKKLFTEPKVKWPNGIAVDYITDRIFWVDAGFRYIASSDLDGGAVKNIPLPKKFTMSPYGIAVFKNKMYWTDWKYEILFSADKAEGKEVEVLYQNLLETRPIGVKIFGNGSQLDTNACDKTTCKYICVGKPKGSSCLCPNDLIYDGQECVCPWVVAPFLNLTCQQDRPKCLDDEFTCDNLLCIRKNGRCDGKIDCADGSDEKCPKLVCKAGTHSCGLPNDQCIPFSWVCDGDVDCTSGSDEKNCTTL